jgi:hypothetical protein
MLLGPENPLRLLSAALLAVAIAVPPSIAGEHHDHRKVFNRIATFPVFLNLPAGADLGTATVAEIVAASEDGDTLIYTDGATGSVGFVDITDPADPKALGLIPVDGGPTSVAVAGPYAIVGVNTSPDFLNPSGFIAVIDIATRTVVRDDIDAIGQPDSIAVSPGGRFAAVVIENERDEGVVVDGVEGGLPQLPAGFLLIIDLDGPPADWSTRKVELTGLAGCAVGPGDPEPEFVDVRQGDIAAVILQENNCIAVVKLRTGSVLRSFNAGAATIDRIDVADDNLITLTEALEDVAREPDAVAWIKGRIATANEGDLFGGTRGFSLFNQRGRVVFDAGNSFEHETDRIFTLYDNAFTAPRIFVMHVADQPAVIEDEIVLTNGTGEPLNVDELDLEGLAQRADGSFWAVSEGAGTVGDPDQPVETPNLLLRIAADGTILEQIELPDAVNALQARFGFEGVAGTGTGSSELVYVAFQREWAGDPDNMVRIGRFDPNEPDPDAAWTFFYFEIKDPTTPNPDPGFVGLSEIVAIDDETFAVVQRDDQGGTDARIKEIVTFSISGLTPLPQPAAGIPTFPAVAQLKSVDLIPALASLNGPVLEKVEGLTIGADGAVYFVTDNDAASDATGETQFMAIGHMDDILSD